RQAETPSETLQAAAEPEAELVNLLVDQAEEDLTSEERRPRRPGSHQSWLKAPLDRAVVERLVSDSAFPETLRSRIAERLREGRHLAFVSHTARTDTLFWNYSFDLLNLLRDRVLYLGPLRQDPQVVYKTLPLQ